MNAIIRRGKCLQCFVVTHAVYMDTVISPVSMSVCLYVCMSAYISTVKCM